MLTSVGHWQEVSGLNRESIDAFLVKPVRHSQLLNTISNTWSKKLATAPSVPAESEYPSSIAALHSRWPDFRILPCAFWWPKITPSIRKLRSGCWSGLESERMLRLTAERHSKWLRTCPTT